MSNSSRKMSVTEFEADHYGRSLFSSPLILTLTRLGKLADTYVAQGASVRGPIIYEPALFVNFDPINKYLDRLCTLADLLRATFTTVDLCETRLRHDLTEMWADNSDLRRPGLRGGTARKQRRAKGNKVPKRELTLEELERRKVVEKVDYQRRNRLAGLTVLREMLESAFAFVRDQQGKCHEIISSGNAMTYGVGTKPVVGRLRYVEDILGEDLEIVEDIEEMVETFYDEYAP